MTDSKHTPEIQTLVEAWQPYLQSADWCALTRGVEPLLTGCGQIYEVGNPLGRANESFAIADMRGIEYAQPHYHANGETEVYFVLMGMGRVVVGNEVLPVSKYDVIVTPPATAHYTLPHAGQGIVLGVVNTPPFNPENNIDLTATNQAVGYDHEQFKMLTQAARRSYIGLQ